MNERGFWQLHDVSNERLVRGLRELLASEGRSEARIVAHLAELDARRLSLKGAQSLFEYCQQTLGLSDNQAYYRISAARVARRFPIVFELLERREIHLTNIAPISKHLSEENHRVLLREAGRLSRRELLKALARRAPRPDVPSTIRRLVPTAGATSAGPTGSLEPLSASSYRLQLNTSEALKQKLELARDLMSHANPSGDLAVVVERGLDLLIQKLQARRFGQTTTAPRKATKADVAEKVQASEVRAATSAIVGGREAGVEASEPSRVTDAPSPAPHRAEGARVEPHFDRSKRDEVTVSATPTQRPAPVEAAADQGEQAHRARERTAPRPLAAWQHATPEKSAHEQLSTQRAHIANETRRQLLARDGLCCSYVGPDGRRCGARALLQIHHEMPWAKGGPDTLANLRLLCRAHNQWLAEREYGSRHMKAAVEGRRQRRQA